MLWLESMSRQSRSQWCSLCVCRRRNKPRTWWRCEDDVVVEYNEEVRVRYEELSEEVGGLEEKWKMYKEAFVGAAEELCGKWQSAKE